MRTLLALAVLVGSAAGLAAQGEKPNFSGTWVMVSPEAGETLVIKHDATTFSFGPKEGPQGRTIVARLDGTETPNQLEIGSAVSKASWNGTQLVLTNAISAAGQTLDQVMRWSLDEKGQLIMEVQNRDLDPMKMVFKKQR